MGQERRHPRPPQPARNGCRRPSARHEIFKWCGATADSGRPRHDPRRTGPDGQRRRMAPRRRKARQRRPDGSPRRRLHPSDALRAPRGSLAQPEDDAGHLPLSFALLLRGNACQRRARHRQSLHPLRPSADDGPPRFLFHPPAAARGQEPAAERAPMLRK